MKLDHESQGQGFYSRMQFLWHYAKKPVIIELIKIYIPKTIFSILSNYNYKK